MLDQFGVNIVVKGKKLIPKKGMYISSPFFNFSLIAFEIILIDSVVLFVKTISSLLALIKFAKKCHIHITWINYFQKK